MDAAALDFQLNRLNMYTMAHTFKDYRFLSRVVRSNSAYLLQRKSDGHIKFTTMTGKLWTKHSMCIFVYNNVAQFFYNVGFKFCVQKWILEWVELIIRAERRLVTHKMFDNPLFKVLTVVQ